MGNTRRYTTNNKIDTWINKRCIKCGKYISKLKRKYCTNCLRIVFNRIKRIRNRSEYNHKYYLEHIKGNRDNEKEATYMWALRRGLFKCKKKN